MTDQTKSSSSAITVKPNESTRLARVLRAYHSASSSNSLLSIPFFSLQDYLYFLKSISDILGQLVQKSMFLLAAAVSDFYIPSDEMPEHKMQSSEGPPEVKLSSVPKMLPVLIHQWAPEAFIVSFKLETDPKLLLLKARKALDTYQHQVVVANILEERRRKVTVITADSETELELSEEQMKDGKELEEDLVQDLVAKHGAFIQSAQGR